MGQQVGERALLREMQPLCAARRGGRVSMPKDAAKIEEAHSPGVLQAGEHLVILVSSGVPSPCAAYAGV